MIVDLLGGLDNNGNCEVGLYEVNRVPLKSQMATAMHEIYIRQEWARANDLTGTIKLPGEPGDATHIPGKECGESLQQPGRRTVGLRSVRPGH